MASADVLDDFNKPVPASSSAKAGAPGASDAALNDPELDDELAKQLAQGMEQLMANMGEHPELKEQMEALVQTFEKDMPAFAEAAGAAAAAKGKTKAESGDRSAEAFQEKIEETLNKLRNSQDKVGAEVMDGMMSDDMMAEMMKQMEGLVESGEFTTALEGMMEQLMAREVLYEPMKDLADKVGFEGWHLRIG